MTTDEIRQKDIDNALVEMQLVVNDLIAARMRPDEIKDKMAGMLPGE